jgi:hypothetical protein
MGAGALGHADQALSTSATARLAVRRRQGVAARSAESVAVLIVAFAVGGVRSALGNPWFAAHPVMDARAA